MNLSQPVMHLKLGNSTGVSDLETNEGVVSNDILQECWLRLKAQLPPSTDVAYLQTWVEQLAWLRSFHTSSQLLIAAINPVGFKLQYANDYFCQLLGFSTGKGLAFQALEQDLNPVLERLLSEADRVAVKQLYRRHLLHLVLQAFYQVDPSQCRLLEAPVMVALHSPLYPEPRYVEFWLRSGQLSVERIDLEQDEFAELGLAHLSSEELAIRLTDPEQFNQLEERLCVQNYRVHGQLLLEGLDVTVRETIRQITQLLIDRDSILSAEKFQIVNHQLRSLFRADNTIILMVESEQIRVLTGSVHQELDITTYPLELLRETCITKAITTNQVLAIRDLALNCQTDLGRKLLETGVRSVLLIPLVSHSHRTALQSHRPHEDAPQVVGLVGVMSDRPNHFDGLDRCYAEQLIPALTRALTSAQQQLMQQRFVTNIHPAVEWRFLQEAERRSLGLPAEPVVFNNVYPLYGISDIRGSSDARNRAIQLDVLEQYQLAVAIVEAVCATETSALSEQLRLDLLERMESLEEKITVDAEITELRYLRTHVETYFDYFAQQGDSAIAAIHAYRTACDNDQQCVYNARADYDKTINQINTLLRDTWDQWQIRMQQITPHYCDVEATDGIDHMIYAGSSIDPKFGDFQLRSLRYEQLRALCDCARTALRFQATNDTTLQVAHLVLVQDSTVDIFHDETTERLFDVRGTRDTRYEIVKKRIDKGVDQQTQARITQPGLITLVYSTNQEQEEYQQYIRYLAREGWISKHIEQGTVEPLQGVTGLKFMRISVLPEP